MRIVMTMTRTWIMTTKGIAFLQEDVMCSLQDKPGIQVSWILHDSTLTVDVFSNTKLLTNIRDIKLEIMVKSVCSRILVIF